jgi:hypothetical protein
MERELQGEGLVLKYFAVAFFPCVHKVYKFSFLFISADEISPQVQDEGHVS